MKISLPSGVCYFCSICFITFVTGVDHYFNLRTERHTQDALSRFQAWQFFVSAQSKQIRICPSLTHKAVVVLAGIIGLALLSPLLKYLLDEKKLRRFPSPSVAAFTPLWLMYHNAFGRRYIAVDEAHKRLGSIVRIAPNHVSFAEPSAYKEIYGHTAPMIKDLWYDNLAAGNPNMTTATDKAVHSRKRKNLSNVFSPKEVVVMEPRIEGLTKILLRDLRLKSQGRSVSEADRQVVNKEGVFDLRPWIHFFTYDAIGSMLWSSDFGFLEKGDDLCFAQTADGTVNRVHGMETFHSNASFVNFLAHLPPWWYKKARSLLKNTYWGKCADNFGGMTRFKIQERLQSPPPAQDLFSHYPMTATEKRPIPMKLPETISENQVILSAASDVTMGAITYTMYLLAANPDKQRALYDNLVNSLPAYERQRSVPSYKSLQNIPYLKACLDESMRLYPPIGFGLPRRTLPGGATIAGYYIPEGVTVSGPVYTIHRSEKLFKNATSFVPERWLSPDSEEEKRNLKAYYFPFSIGGRACIGRNMGYLEMTLSVAAMILAFEWELATPGFEIVPQEKFVCNPGPLPVRAKLRLGWEALI
jgi:benzoate 4-monooxygenase